MFDLMQFQFILEMVGLFFIFYIYENLNKDNKFLKMIGMSGIIVISTESVGYDFFFSSVGLIGIMILIFWIIKSKIDKKKEIK